MFSAPRRTQRTRATDEGSSPGSLLEWPAGDRACCLGLQHQHLSAERGRTFSAIISCNRQCYHQIAPVTSSAVVYAISSSLVISWDLRSSLARHHQKHPLPSRHRLCHHHLTLAPHLMITIATSSKLLCRHQQPVSLSATCVVISNVTNQKSSSVTSKANVCVIISHFLCQCLQPVASSATNASATACAITGNTCHQQQSVPSSAICAILSNLCHSQQLVPFSAARAILNKLVPFSATSAILSNLCLPQQPVPFSANLCHSRQPVPFSANRCHSQQPMPLSETELPSSAAYAMLSKLFHRHQRTPPSATRATMSGRPCGGAQERVTDRSLLKKIFLKALRKEGLKTV